MKKILFCTPAPLTKSLGAAKVIVELAEEMRMLEWDCGLICPTDIAAPGDPTPKQSFAVNLRSYLKKNGGNYDVVDYDHEYLPYARAEFCSTTLFVARSVLLAQHLDQISIPTGKSFKAQVGSIIKTNARRKQQQQRILVAQATVENADLINVSNDLDKVELMRRGFPSEKIVVLPYGISRTRRFSFDQVSSQPPSKPVISFVGTFDYRKGASEFPKIVEIVVAAVPEVLFKLFGTKGMFQTEAEVRVHFPHRLQAYLEILPTYLPEDLPHLLSSCSVGIFPSYVEGMPFGVLEMLAASVPVVAYASPGAPMMLPNEFLVQRGHAEALAQKTIALIQSERALMEARASAKQQSQKFTWTAVAQQTDAVYRQALKELRAD